MDFEQVAVNVVNSNGNLVIGRRNMVYWKHLIKKER